MVEFANWRHLKKCWVATKSASQRPYRRQVGNSRNTTAVPMMAENHQELRESGVWRALLGWYVTAAQDEDSREANGISEGVRLVDWVFAVANCLLLWEAGWLLSSDGELATERRQGFLSVVARIAAVFRDIQWAGTGGTAVGVKAAKLLLQSTRDAVPEAAQEHVRLRVALPLEELGHLASILGSIARIYLGVAEDRLRKGSPYAVQAKMAANGGVRSLADPEMSHKVLCATRAEPDLYPAVATSDTQLCQPGGLAALYAHIWQKQPGEARGADWETLPLRTLRSFLYQMYGNTSWWHATLGSREAAFKPPDFLIIPQAAIANVEAEDLEADAPAAPLPPSLDPPDHCPLPKMPRGGKTRRGRRSLVIAVEPDPAHSALASADGPDDLEIWKAAATQAAQLAADVGVDYDYNEPVAQVRPHRQAKEKGQHSLKGQQGSTLKSKVKTGKGGKGKQKGEDKKDAGAGKRKRKLAAEDKAGPSHKKPSHPDAGSKGEDSETTASTESLPAAPGRATEAGKDASTVLKWRGLGATAIPDALALAAGMGAEEAVGPAQVVGPAGPAQGDAPAAPAQIDAPGGAEVIDIDLEDDQALSDGVHSADVSVERETARRGEAAPESSSVEAGPELRAPDVVAKVKQNVERTIVAAVSAEPVHITSDVHKQVCTLSDKLMELATTKAPDGSRSFWDKVDSLTEDEWESQGQGMQFATFRAY